LVFLNYREEEGEDVKSGQLWVWRRVFKLKVHVHIQTPHKAFKVEAHQPT